MSAFEPQVSVERAYKKGPSGYIAQRGRYEVAYRHCIYGHVSPFKHAGRDEEHVGDTVFVSQNHKCRYRYPAACHLFCQGITCHCKPYCQAYTPVCPYPADEYHPPGQCGFCLCHPDYGAVVGVGGGYPGQVCKEVCHGQRPGKIAIQTSVQFLSTADGRMSRRIMPGMRRALLPVKSSAPRTTTSTRPMGNTRPLSIFWSDGFPADASGNPYPATTDSSPPSAMNAPAANDMPINLRKRHYWM